MLRAVLAAFAALAMSACSYGSAVDIAPFKARISKPVAAPGDYCEVQGETAPFTIVSHEDCAPITWDQATRTYTLVDTEDKDDSIQTAVVSLGSGLYVAQVETPEAKDRYQLHTLLAKGDAFTMLPVLDDEPLAKLAARHKRIVWEKDSHGRLFIASGSSDRIKSFLREAAKESLRTLKAEGDAISLGVLDRNGAADHPATAQQTKDIEAVLKLARSMTP